MTRREQVTQTTKGILSALFKRSLYTAGVLVTGLALIQLYFAVMPGDWFLHYDQADATSIVEGEDLPVTLCRTRQFGIGAVNAEATRTFYYSPTRDGNYMSAGNYSYTPSIENGEPCVTVTVKHSRFAHKAGYYWFHTDLKFKASGYEKTTSYDSDHYRVFARPTDAERLFQLQQEAERLQRQIDQLRAQAGAVAVGVSGPTSTARTVEPTTSAPPDSASMAPTMTPLIDVTPLLLPVAGVAARAGVAL